MRQHRVLHSLVKDDPTLYHVALHFDTPYRIALWCMCYNVRCHGRLLYRIMYVVGYVYGEYGEFMEWRESILHCLRGWIVE